MGPGDDCPPHPRRTPPHLVRYPSAASIAKLAERFNLPNRPSAQDWEVEVAGFARAGDFLDANPYPANSDENRFLLMELIVASLDEGASSGAQLGELRSRTRRLLLRDPRLHAPTLSWS